VQEARAGQPDEPLVRGDELGLPPGPEIGRLLDLIEEERAAGTISTHDEALELARREARR
jgi:poly(A) polymerase